MIAVTGSTGHLGRLVIADLLERGVPAGEIVAVARDPQQAADLAARGGQVRLADYDRPETLPPALAGVDRLLFISGNQVGQRVRQHGNVVDAAVAAGVGLVAYTSIVYADTSAIPLAAEHKATEELIRAAGLPYVFLRNTWYVENYTANLAPALATGAIIGAAGEGRVAAVPRADFAAAAAAVVTTDGHENMTYELGADRGFTLAELAAEVSRQTGKEIVYRDLSADEYAAALVAAGLPEPFAQSLAAGDLGLARGELDVTSGDLSRLIGRPTTPLADSVAAGLTLLPR
jgi:NAD(P)H dehydrogenase (quinone)